MRRTIRGRLAKLEDVKKCSNKMFAMLTFQDGTKKVLKSMEVSFAWLCGSVADEQGRVVADIEILPDGQREYKKELEIIQQILKGGEEYRRGNREPVALKDSIPPSLKNILR